MNERQKHKKTLLSCESKEFLKIYPRGPFGPSLLKKLHFQYEKYL